MCDEEQIAGVVNMSPESEMDQVGSSDDEEDSSCSRQFESIEWSEMKHVD